ncbi:MAG: alpha-1,4-glucan--maltose-1-phosphate maltosyltransferase [Candidatus Ancaeobacter aquaticus]|nr:alpha-1,4-glucan--maltose-1-phosphate maltosyltransferase [Candidatus Ancaeobacter aquaticus]
MEKKQKRIIFKNVSPQIECAKYPIKRCVDDGVTVSADVLSDGHDHIYSSLLYKKEKDSVWSRSPMTFIENDRWQGVFTVTETGSYVYTFEGYIDHYGSWLKDIDKKIEAKLDVSLDIKIGIEHIENALKRIKGKGAELLKNTLSSLRKTKDIEVLLTICKETKLIAILQQHPDIDHVDRHDTVFSVTVDRKKALFSSWYEMFPRSCIAGNKSHGTFTDCISFLPEIKRMGFDVLYFPPIHPIGTTNRKGKNNATVCKTDDPGSPWAIGSRDGGHTDINPLLGTLKDFRKLVQEALKHGIEIALDIAFQCSPDHPYIKKYPQWFKYRPDGTIQFAENPPKKYEDIVPFDFETVDWKNLWEELKNIVLYWIDNGVRILRVDNPHTKPLAFWHWLISEIKDIHPDVIFLSEAFTRPKIMHHLAKLGFTQSYTYFTWRNTKHELTEYMTELTTTDAKEYFRPNLWPNTPDILHEYLQCGGRGAFITRFILAATLSSNYGIYGPAYELCIHEPLPGREEYCDSEKYEIKKWDRAASAQITDIIAKTNAIRKENPALQSTNNIQFIETDNDVLLAYCKKTDGYQNIILVIVNLDPHNTQSGWITVPHSVIGREEEKSYLAHDLLTDEKYIWNSERNFVRLDPFKIPAHIIRIHPHIHREDDFDYYT